MGEILLNPKRIISKANELKNFNQFYQVFKGHKRIFQNVKYSKKLGIITFRWADKQIIITRFGKIKIQKAKNEQDLQDTFNYLINLLIEHKLVTEPI